jgi:alcohol dehydrogenase
MGALRPYAESRPLQVEEVSVAPPGPGEVLVEVAAAGLCHSDLSVIDGSRPRPLPMVLGHEAAGIVREVGPGVEEVRAGDHVVFSFVPACGRCAYCAVGRPALCEPGARASTEGTLLGGGRRFADRNGAPLHHHLGVSAFSQYTVAAAGSVVPVDPALPLETAALFGCAVTTGVGAVVNTAQVPAGTAVAVFGLGGVGLSVVMGARAAGATPIVAVDLVPEKLARARALGASVVVDAREADPVEAIRDVTGGGAAYVFESVGNEAVLEQAYRATRRGGTTVAIGLPHPDRRLSVPAVSLAAEERTVRGSYMGSAVPRRDIPRFIAMHRAGLLPVERLLDARLRLEEINAGFDALAQGQVVRQVVRLGARAGG